MGQTPTDCLPPKELWPQGIYTLPEIMRPRWRFNSTKELPDKTVVARKPAAYKGPREVECLDRIPRVTDPLARIHDDPLHSKGERREIIVGHSSRGRLLLVSFTERRLAVRLINARRVTRHERQDYEQGTRF